MKEFIEKKGEKILEILGHGGSRRIAERMKTKYGVTKTSGLIWKMLSGKVPESFKPSEQMYEYIYECSLELIEESNKETTLFLQESVAA
jgi:hypothetical protein